MKKMKKSLRMVAIIVTFVLAFSCVASASTRTTYWLAGDSEGTSCGSQYFSNRQYTIQLGASTAKYNLYAWLQQGENVQYGKKWMSSAISGSYLWTLTPAAGTYTIMASNNSSTGYYINFAIS